MVNQAEASKDTAIDTYESTPQVVPPPPVVYEQIHHKQEGAPQTSQDNKDYYNISKIGHYENP